MLEFTYSKPYQVFIFMKLTYYAISFYLCRLLVQINRLEKNNFEMVQELALKNFKLKSR